MGRAEATSNAMENSAINATAKIKKFKGEDLSRPGPVSQGHLDRQFQFENLPPDTLALTKKDTSRFVSSQARDEAVTKGESPEDPGWRLGRVSTWNRPLIWRR